MAEQAFKAKLPSGLSRTEKLDIADRVIEFILRRTEGGKDKDGKNFPKYSKEYVKSLDFRVAGKSRGSVNLTLSGDMLAAIELLNPEVSRNVLRIGIPASDTENSAKAEGNIKGSYGGSPNPRKARDFLGIKKSDLDKIIENVIEDSRG